MASLFNLGFLLIIVKLAEINVATAQTCNSFSGPAGVSACVRIDRPYYNDYQWATCVSNAYMKLITANQYSCANTAATYCWYQCMLETYLSLGPEVRGICLCKQGQTTPSVISPTTLAPSCYSPDGTSCDWYVNCLEKTYNCDGTAAGYAVEYGNTFCNMFSQNLDWFSALGQQWVNSVRKCLQVCLAPLLRQYNAPTCEEIRTQAISSHRPCYLNMGCHLTASPNYVSICDLPLSDIFKVAWTIRQAFVDPTTAAESVCGMIDTARSCAKSWNSTRTDTCMRSFMALVAVAPGTSQSTTASPQFAARVANAISAAANLSSHGVSVLGCLFPSSNRGQMLINLIITAADVIGNCLKDLESSTVIVKRSSAIDYNAVASSVQRWVENGSVLDVNGVPAYVQSVGECNPMTCSNSTSRNVTAPPVDLVVWPSTTTSSTTTTTTTKSAAVMVSSNVFKLLVITYLMWFIFHACQHHKLLPHA